MLNTGLELWTYTIDDRGDTIYMKKCLQFLDKYDILFLVVSRDIPLLRLRRAQKY